MPATLPSYIHVGWERRQIRTDRAELSWGTLRLRQLNFEVPDGAAVQTIQGTLVTSADQEAKPRELSAEFTQPERGCMVELAQPIELKPGQQIEITLTW